MFCSRRIQSRQCSYNKAHKKRRHKVSLIAWEFLYLLQGAARYGYQTYVYTVSDSASGGSETTYAWIASFIKEQIKVKTMFVSWDAVHFEKLLSIKTMTPQEFLLSLG